MGLRLNIPKISQDVSTAKEDVGRAGAVGRAMSSLGDSVQSLGKTVGQIASIEERRKEEKRKAEISLRKRMYQAKLSAEHENIKDEFKNDPDAGLKAYNQRKEKLTQQLFAGVEDGETLSRLNNEKSIIDATYDSRSESHKNLRNVEISKESLDQVAEVEAIDFRNNPQPIDDVYRRLHGQKANIDGRDIRMADKAKIWDVSQKKMILGAINGYMGANTLRGFAKAEEFIEGVDIKMKKDAMGREIYDNSKLRIRNKDQYLRMIKNRRLQYINEKANRDRINKKLIQEQFQREILPMREAVNMKIADPTADVSADYKKLRRMGVVSGPNKAMSRASMDQHKAYRSRQRLMGLLESMSEVTNKYTRRKQIYNDYFRGILAAEDADVALNALEADIVKSYGKYQARESDRILKQKATVGKSILDRRIDPEMYVKIATLRDNLVRDKGIPPITAARMIIRQQGGSTLDQKARRAFRILDPDSRKPDLVNVEKAKMKLVEEFKKAKGDPKKIKKLERNFVEVIEVGEDIKNDQIDPVFMKILQEVEGVKSEE